MLQSFHPFPQGSASIYHETSQVPSFDRQTISWVIVGKKKKIIITITIITITVITRNVSNKHSPVQSGSTSDWPQPNGSIIDGSSAACQTPYWLKKGGQCCRLLSASTSLSCPRLWFIGKCLSVNVPLCCEKKAQRKVKMSLTWSENRRAVLWSQLW